MAVTSTGTVTVVYTGDISATFPFASVQNTLSPGSITTHTLTTGANTITLPTGGSTIKSALIIPPAANAQDLTLKGVAGDTGVFISLTAPTLLTFKASPAATFVLNAAGAVTGLKIYWS